MTQPDPAPQFALPTTAVQMRQRIEQALADAEVELGIYRFEGGAKAPAFYMGDPPEGTTVEGLEVLMSPNPKRTSVDAFEYLGAPLSYPVRLINHADQPDVLEHATNALAEAFWPFDDEPALLPATINYPEQATFSLFFFHDEKEQ